MHRLRWIIAGLLTISVAVAVGCLQKSENDASCYKDVDCASGSCVSFKCIDPNVNRPPFDAATTTTTPDTATEAAAESGAETSTSDSAADGTADASSD